MASRSITEAILELAERLGVTAIGNLPGCWEHAVDKTWWFAVNGRAEPMTTSDGVFVVDACAIFVKYNGWPAGVVYMTKDGEQGEFAAHETGANETNFIAACDAAEAS